MKKIQFALSPMLPAMALAAVLCFASRPIFARSTQYSSDRWISQQRPMQPNDQVAASGKMFSGKIVKSGNKLVLVDDTKITYQLDDQQKAQDFLNKNVKVTGVLDASTGTIRVTAIEPA